MKKYTAYQSPVAVLALALLAATPLAAAPGKEMDQDRGILEVQVNIPPNWRPWLEDRVSESFVARVRDVFRRHGYEGTVKEVRTYEKPDPNSSMLNINLFEWRVNQIGNIECTFTADLQTANGNRNFGPFVNTTMSWIGGTGRFGLEKSFDEAAEGAIRELYRDLAKSELVPGLRS